MGIQCMVQVQDEQILRGNEKRKKEKKKTKVWKFTLKLCPLYQIFSPIEKLLALILKSLI